MKVFKVVSTFALIFCLLIAMSSATAFGASTYTVSEYDMIKNLQKSSKAELIKAGYSKKEIDMIKQPLKSKEKYGLVTYTISYSKMYQKKGYTYLRTKMTWSWSQVPACTFTDIAAMTTSKEFLRDSATATVYYYVNGDKSRKRVKKHPKVRNANSGQGVYCRFKLGRGWDRDNKTYTSYAMKGSIVTNWSIDSKVKQVGISSNYGHTKIDITPGVSISASGASIGFTPKASCKSGDETYIKAKLKK